MGSDGVAFPGLGVAPLVDSGTDHEDELSTPDGSPSTDAVKPGEVVIPEICPAPLGGLALDLAKALLEVSVLPIVDPVVQSLGTPVLYLEPPLPVLESVDEQVLVLVSSPLREVAGSSGGFSVIPGVAYWLRVWADHFPNFAVFADG